MGLGPSVDSTAATASEQSVLLPLEQGPSLVLSATVQEYDAQATAHLIDARVTSGTSVTTVLCVVCAQHPICTAMGFCKACAVHYCRTHPQQQQPQGQQRRESK